MSQHVALIFWSQSVERDEDSIIDELAGAVYSGLSNLPTVGIQYLSESWLRLLRRSSAQA
jgi:hypothetical protein